jgi:hypothetical protein
MAWLRANRDAAEELNSIIVYGAEAYLVWSLLRFWYDGRRRQDKSF